MPNDKLDLDNAALSGDDLYALVYDGNGQIADTVDEAFEAITDAQWANYVISLTEQGTASGFFVADMPSWIAAGIYKYAVRKAANGVGNEAPSDITVGVEVSRYWTGSAWRSLSDLDASVASRSSHDDPGPDIAALNDFDPANDTVASVGDKTGYSLSTAGIQAIWSYAKASAAALAETTIGRYIYDKLNLITSGSVTFTSPVLVSDDVELVQGDDYKQADGRALEWSSSGWPDLTSAQSITFTAKRKSDDDETFFDVSAPTTGSGEQTIRTELTTAETAVLTAGDEVYRFDVEAVLQNGNNVTLVRGDMTVLED